MARVNQTTRSVEAEAGSVLPRVARSRGGAECLTIEEEDSSPAFYAPLARTPIGHVPVALTSFDEAIRQSMERTIALYLPGVRLHVQVTDNHYTMISVRRNKGAYKLRMHHMFLAGGPEIVQALGRYVSQNDRAASDTLSAFIDANQNKIRRGRRKRHDSIPMQTRGIAHDLQDLFDELNARYFNNTIDARITWGIRPKVMGKKRRRNSIKMGSYAVEDRLIRIHPSLDRPFVPRYFVAWIVYHEMLHQKHDIPIVDGRRQFHTPAFMAEERLFDEFERAQQWERVHLNRLLVY